MRIASRMRPEGRVRRGLPSFLAFAHFCAGADETFEIQIDSGSWVSVSPIDDTRGTHTFAMPTLAGGEQIIRLRSTNAAGYDDEATFDLTV